MPKMLFILVLVTCAMRSALGFIDIPLPPLEIPPIFPPPRKSSSTLSLVGGTNLDKPEPYMASVRWSSGGHKCGGTLIHPRTVLTAAHCVSPGQKPAVHIGRYRREGSDSSSGFDSYSTTKTYVHESYDPNSYNSDIALLVLDSSSSRTKMPLATSDSCFEDRGGCRVRLLGWGDTSSGGSPSDILQEAFTTSVSRRTCENLYGGSRIRSTMICAGELKGGGYDSCQGDSGGPMIENGKQVGIVSFGEGCGDAEFPGVYASVPKFRLWIDSKLAEVDSPPSVSSDPCECAKDGVSNGVSTRRFGCAQHLLAEGDDDSFCMTVGGLDCGVAKPSDTFPGAAWILCP